jgi:hypothetical protein
MNHVTAQPWRGGVQRGVLRQAYAAIRAIFRISVDSTSPSSHFFWRLSQKPGEAPNSPGKHHRHLRANAAFPSANLIDSFWEEMQMPGKLRLRKPALLQFIFKNAAGMDRGSVHRFS